MGSTELIAYTIALALGELSTRDLIDATIAQLQPGTRRDKRAEHAERAIAALIRRGQLRVTLGGLLAAQPTTEPVSVAPHRAAARRYKGRIPASSEARDCHMLAETTLSDGSRWQLYLIAQRNADPAWRGYKVIARGVVTGKANYWLGYNEVEHRWSNVTALQQLTKREELWAWVKDQCEL